MTSYVHPTAIELVIELAKAQPCTCQAYSWAPDDIDSFEQCFPHQVIGLLRPTITAWEPTL